MIQQSVESTDDLRLLIELFGWNRVWNVGTKFLGYPPTWEPSLIEILRLKKELEKEPWE